MRTVTRMFAIAIMSGLAACGHAVDPTNHGYGFEYDAQAESGLRVRYSANNSFRIDDVETVYEQVGACMGIVELPHGPLVIFAQPPPGDEGHIFYDTDTIIIDEFIVVGTHNQRHELVHYLLDQAGFPRDSNRAHLSPFFTACT